MEIYSDIMEELFKNGILFQCNGTERQKWNLIPVQWNEIEGVIVELVRILKYNKC